MENGHEASVEGARSAADRGELGEWVAAFLRSPGSDNAALAEELESALVWWIGPVQLSGRRSHWSIVGFDDTEQRDRFIAESSTR